MVSSAIYRQDGSVKLIEQYARFSEYNLMCCLGCQKPVILKTNRPDVCVVTSEEAYLKRGTSLNKRMLDMTGRVAFGDVLVIETWRLK